MDTKALQVLGWMQVCCAIANNGILPMVQRDYMQWPFEVSLPEFLNTPAMLCATHTLWFRHQHASYGCLHNVMFTYLSDWKFDWHSWSVNRHLAVVLQPDGTVPPSPPLSCILAIACVLSTFQSALQLQEI